MPRRVLDFDAMWGSDKLASCAEWAQAEYAWLYGLADASGSFELTNLRVIWGRVAAIRRNLTIERLEQIFAEFEDKGLLFAWGHEGKRYGHWTGSDVPGRLPPPSWRMRLERLAPAVPKQALAEYMSKFARGRGGLAGAGFTAEGNGARMAKAETGGGEDLREGHFKSGNSELRKVKAGVEEGQAQDWNLNQDLNQEWNGSLDSVGKRSGNGQGTDASRSGSKAKHSGEETAGANAEANAGATAGANNSGFGYRRRDKEDIVAAELRVGRGPVCGPARVRPEALERIRQRDAAEAAARAAARAAAMGGGKGRAR
jgi:hypothetical protein